MVSFVNFIWTYIFENRKWNVKIKNPTFEFGSAGDVFSGLPMIWCLIFTVFQLYYAVLQPREVLIILDPWFRGSLQNDRTTHVYETGF
jgi:hypothetical protein